MAVLSFAHLKKKSAQQTSSPAPPARLQRLMGIGIEKTALLASVNYCDGCNRFWPADENEKNQGVLYGRCCRVAGWRETWAIIPVTAKVDRCWYHIQEESFWICKTNWVSNREIKSMLDVKVEWSAESCNPIYPA